MKNLLLLIVYLMAFSLFGLDKFLYVGSVSRPPEKDWRLTPGDIKMEQVAWPNGESGLTIKFTYSAKPDGWPSAKFYLPEELRDWRSAQKLIIEIYCTVPCRVGLEVTTFKDAQRMKWNSLHFPVGRNTISVDVKDMKDFDVSNVKYIDIFSSRPTESYALYVGDIRLEVSDPVTEATEFRNALAAERQQLSRRIQALGEEVPQLIQELLQQNAALPETPGRDELKAFQTACKNAYPTLDKRIFQANARDNLAVFWCLPEEKVLRDTYAFVAPVTPEYTLDAARGESESAQLVAYSPQGLSSVRAELVSAPVNGDGVALPLEALTLCPLGYVKTTKPNYKVDYIGYWPDPILEYLDTPIPLEADCYQSWWLDARIPEDQAPGLYQGQVRFVTEKGSTLLHYSIRVRNFNLTKGVPYFSPVHYGALPTYPADEAARKQYNKAIAKMLIDHRLQPDAIYSGPDRTDLVSTAQENLANGSYAFNIGYINEEVTDELYNKIADAYQRVKAAGLLDKAYIYCFDEAPASEFPKIKKALQRVRQAAPGVPIYTTLYDSSFGIASDLDELVDAWIPLTTVYGQNPKGIEEARARGKKVGWYVCCSPWSPYANFLLEYPGVGVRLLMGYMNWKFKTDHFLYYNCCVWREWNVKNGEYTFKHMIETPITGGPLFDYPWIGESFRDFSGDGRLLYPAAQTPVPTQRLKCIREGVDDWMRLDLLKKCLADSGKMSQEWRTAAEKELQVEDQLVTTLTNWTLDPMMVHEKSRRVAELLEEFFLK